MDRRDDRHGMEARKRIHRLRCHSPKYWPESFVHYINSYGQDKVIFGTDFPVLDFERTRAEIEALELRPGPKRKFLRDNIIRIYKLDRFGIS